MAAPMKIVENVQGKFADKKLQAIADETGISKDMIKWWKTQRCTTIGKVAIVCTEEKEVKAEIIDGSRRGQPQGRGGGPG